ncbi:hypothetical protein ALC56_06283, partial [Trachymyrmex septentrionalis]
RPNQCKQLDIAGNISFLRTARRSTAKRAQTTATAVEGGRGEGCKELRRQKEDLGTALHKPVRIHQLADYSPPYEISTDTLFPIRASVVIMAYGHLLCAQCRRGVDQTWDHVVVYPRMFTGHSLDIVEDLFALRITTVRKSKLTPLADVSQYSDS